MKGTQVEQKYVSQSASKGDLKTIPSQGFIKPSGMMKKNGSKLTLTKLQALNTAQVTVHQP